MALPAVEHNKSYESPLRLFISAKNDSHHIINELSDMNPDALLLGTPDRNGVRPFDEALAGIVFEFGKLPRAIYDQQRLIQILQQDMTYEEAFEYFEYNISGAYMGPHTPLFLYRGH